MVLPADLPIRTRILRATHGVLLVTHGGTLEMIALPYHLKVAGVETTMVEVKVEVTVQEVVV